MDSSSQDLLAKSTTVCRLCRQRKVGCDRKLPRCGFCVRNGVPCQYTGASRQPGLRAGYVARLEAHLHDLEQRVKALEQKKEDDVDSPPQSVPSLSPTLSRSIALPVWQQLAPELCNVWFARYHAWFPILHQPSVLETVSAGTWDPEQARQQLVIKAMVAATLVHAESAADEFERDAALPEQLYNEVVMEAMGHPTLQAIQALLILGNIEYGAGRSNQFWHLVALCKRMCLHLGLRDLVIHVGANFQSMSTIPPRMLPLPLGTVETEERVRAYWMTEVLDSLSTLGGAWNLGVSSPEAGGIMPCSDSLWAFPEHIISLWPFGDFYFSSAFSLLIILVTHELWHVHRFLQRPLDPRDAAHLRQWREDARQLDARLAKFRADFDAAVQALVATDAAQAQALRADTDPNLVLTRCTLDCAIIAIFQRFTPGPACLDVALEPWDHAAERCCFACDDMCAAIAQLGTDELDVANPHILLLLFVALRFYLLHAKATDADISSNTYILANALRLCSARWPRARKYSSVVRTAIGEHRVPVLRSRLPLQFYDPKYATLDIDQEILLVGEELA